MKLSQLRIFVCQLSLQCHRSRGSIFNRDTKLVSLKLPDMSGLIPRHFISVMLYEPARSHTFVRAVPEGMFQAQGV